MTAIFGDLPKNQSWKSLIDGCDNIGEQREKYWQQPRCKAWKAYVDDSRNKSVTELHGISSFYSSPDDYLCSREEFVNQKRLAAISTFAVLHEGQWAERGKMGWWGSVSDENDNWEQTFVKILKTIPDDTLLTIVDCHI